MEDDNVETAVVKVRPPEPPRINLISLGSKGELEIAFSDNIFIPPDWNKKWENDKAIRRLREAGGKEHEIRRLQDNSFSFIDLKVEGATNGEQIKLDQSSVAIEDLTENKIRLKITYDNPALVSMGDQSVQDRLILGIN